MALSNRKKKMVSWLTIVLLLGNSAITSICQHEHAEGGTPHESHSHHHLSHDVAHGHHSHNHSHADNTTQLKSGFIDTHVHVAVLGFQITLSVPEQDHSDESQHLFDNQTSFVMWNPDFISRAESDANTLDYDPIKSSSYVSVDRPFASEVNLSSTTPTYVLLCDAARHKRSGVLCF